jgi:pimeloyl-ACP methyl ester carboxylesterase
MPVVRNDGVAVAYDRAGPDDADPVVMLEGWSYGRWMWRWQRAALDDHLTVVPDNRGSGDSEAPGLGMPGLVGALPESLRQLVLYKFHREKYAIPRLADDVAAVLDDAGLEDAHVVGASMGGMVALQFAVEYDRVRSLSLLCTTAGGEMADLIPDATREHLESVPDGLSYREEVEYLMEPATTAEWRAANQDTLDDIAEWRAEQDAPPAAREAQAMGQLGFDVRDQLDDIDAPVQVLHGDADEVVPVERGEELADGLGVELSTYEGGPHLFFVERADAVNEQLRSFLEGA